MKNADFLFFYIRGRFGVEKVEKVWKIREKIDKKTGYATITLDTEELGVLRNALYDASKNEKFLKQKTFKKLYAYSLILHTLTQSGNIPSFEFDKAYNLLFSEKVEKEVE